MRLGTVAWLMAASLSMVTRTVFRMGESENSQLIARMLASLTPRLYASPSHLERSGEPASFRRRRSDSSNFCVSVWINDDR